MDKYVKYRILFLAFYFLSSCSKDPSLSINSAVKIDILVKNLELPWGMAFLPNGDLIFTERRGKINLLKKDAAFHNTIMFRQVPQNSEGGLLGIAVDPDFNMTHHVFIYETTDSNRVVRFKLENEILTEEKVVLGNIPQAENHDGGALNFGPDGYLYVGTGDAKLANSAQDKNSLAGKILRINKDGTAPSGNPFKNKVWSFGHRNVQGFAWTNAGKMLATEHGPTGEFGWCCHDEINLVEPGKNYGWPLALGGTETDSLKPPLYQSGIETWAPSGCVFVKGSRIWHGNLLVAALKGKKIIRFNLDLSGTVIIRKTDTLEEQFNRIRNIIEAPDGALVFCTSNLGTINPLISGDDKIYRLYLK